MLEEIPFEWGITEDPIKIGSTQAPGAYQGASSSHINFITDPIIEIS